MIFELRRLAPSVIKGDREMLNNTSWSSRAAGLYRRRILRAGTVVVAAALVGIASFAGIVPVLAETMAAPRADALPLDTVLITDKRFRRRVIVESVHAERTVTDTVEVVVRFVNRTRRFVQLEGRSMFLDANARQTEPTSAWRSILLPPNSIAVYRETSVGTLGVEHYLVEVRGVERR